MTIRAFLAEGINYVPYRARPWIKSVPVVATFQRWLLGRFLAETPFVHTIDAGPAAGLRVEVKLPPDKAIWTGTYEAGFTSAICQSVNRGDICYDVGGYRGYMSGAMAITGAGKVFVFEPLPENQIALNTLCALNPNLPIEVIHCALGSTDGTAALNIVPQSSMAKLASSCFQTGALVTREIPVSIRRIDSLVRDGQIPAPRLIKIDVEGAEIDVLRGACSVLRACRPKIFLEAHGAALEDICTRYLSEFGYTIRRITRGTLSEESTRHLVCLP